MSFIAYSANELLVDFYKHLQMLRFDLYTQFIYCRILKNA